MSGPARYLDESAALRAWRELPHPRKVDLLCVLRADIRAVEEDGSKGCIAHARALRIAHDALVAAGALGPEETMAAHERRRAR